MRYHLYVRLDGDCELIGHGHLPNGADVLYWRGKETDCLAVYMRKRFDRHSNEMTELVVIEETQ